MSLVRLAGNFWSYPLCSFLFLAQFPATSFPLPLGNKSEANFDQILPAPTAIQFGYPFYSTWLTLLCFVIVPLLLLDLCWLFVRLTTRPRQVIPTQNSLVCLVQPVERHPDVESAIVLVESEGQADSTPRGSQSDQIATTHGDDSPRISMAAESVANFQVLPFDSEPYTAATPTIGTTLTLSVASISEGAHYSNDLVVRDTTVPHPPISPQTPSSLSLAGDGPSRSSSYTLPEDRSFYSPTGSTRPPTYRTRASEATISTLPLYQENEDLRLSRASSRRSTYTTRARRERSVSPPPLPPLSLPEILIGGDGLQHQ